MRCNCWQSVRRALLVAGGLALLPASMALAVTATTSFQNGVDGYTGTFDRNIDERVITDPTLEQDGSTVPHYFVDGFADNSIDEQGLIRFDDIIGNGPGQIPSGAFILDAKLTLTTSPAGNAQSTGPFGVSGLLEPFDSNTSYTDFPAFRGPWYQDGTATRPVGGFGPQVQAGVDSADVRALVQSWADGSMTNNGLTVQSGFTGSSDGWGINTTGYPLPERRPKLSVTYTTDPIEMNTFQQDLNGYTGNSMAFVQSGEIALASTTNPDPSVDDVTTDGLTLTDATFLDGPQFADTIGTLSSSDNLALIKFDNVFGNGADQAPTDVPVAKAWLVLTSGDTSADTRSTGIWSAHAMLRDWDFTNLHSNFGDLPGLQVVDGDIEPAVDSRAGMITGSEVWFDVTDYLEGVREGATDFGLAVQSAGTADGWQINFNGASDTSLRPRLLVASGDAAIVAPDLAGDFNADGIVDAADYTMWRDNLGTDFDLNGNGNETGASAGIVDAADYTHWKSNFGNVADGGGPLGSGGAVPEPSTCVLALLAATLGVFGARKRS